MNNFNYPEMCIICAGYKTIPSTFNSTAPLKMCTCKPLLGWECPRCHKINAPLKQSCNCLPFNPLGSILYNKTDSSNNENM